MQLNYRDKIVRDTHLQLSKRIKSLSKKYGKAYIGFVTQAEMFVVKCQMPPFVDSTFKTPTPIGMRLLLANDNPLSLAATTSIVEYYSHNLELLKQRSNRSREAFVRIVSLMYFVDALIDILIGRNELVLTDEVKQRFKSYTSAILNFMEDIDRRKTETGVYALSGNNVLEAAESLDTIKAILSVATVSEWYSTYQLSLDRFILKRLE
nr:MAG TPA: hypothetical protein [Caudoviricetes sp.]